MRLQSWLRLWMWLSSSRHALLPHLQPVWDSYTTMHWHWLAFWRTDVKNGDCWPLGRAKAGSNSGCGCLRNGMPCSLICSCMGLKCQTFLKTDEILWIFGFQLIFIKLTSSSRRQYKYDVMPVFPSFFFLFLFLKEEYDYKDTSIFFHTHQY